MHPDPTHLPIPSCLPSAFADPPPPIHTHKTKFKSQTKKNLSLEAVVWSNFVFLHG